MMSKAKISMKLLIDKSKRKVLFAEAGKECVDFFFHILSLPLGTVVGYLSKASMVGSVGGLYESLGTDYTQEGLNKDCLLNPKPATGASSNVPLLSVNQSTPECDCGAKTFYTCITTEDDCCLTSTIHRYVSDCVGAKCPECQLPLDQELKYLKASAAENKEAQTSTSVAGYVKGVVTYMIMDNLSIKPMSTISSISLLNKFNIQDVGCLEERDVTLDMDLGVALLKASLMSKTAY